MPAAIGRTSQVLSCCSRVVWVNAVHLANLLTIVNFHLNKTIYTTDQSSPCRDCTIVGLRVVRRVKFVAWEGVLHTKYRKGQLFSSFFGNASNVLEFPRNTKNARVFWNINENYNRPSWLVACTMCSCVPNLISTLKDWGENHELCGSPASVGILRLTRDSDNFTVVCVTHNLWRITTAAGSSEHILATSKEEALLVRGDVRRVQVRQ